MKSLSRSFFRSTLLALTLSATVLTSAMAAPQAARTAGLDDDDSRYYVNDPLEGVNRITFAFNEALDATIVTPIIILYRLIFPEIVRDSVHNVLDNAKSPVYLANELLQGDWEGAGTVTKRFAYNTTLGVAGIMDYAEKQGIPGQSEDFGQTLAVWGVDSGPYIVWPILGPSNARDSVGFVADMFMDPINWYAWNTDRDAILYTRAGLTYVDTQDQYHDMFNDLRKNSGDYYTTLQSVYTQRRNALIADDNPDAVAMPSIPDYQ